MNYFIWMEEEARGPVDENAILEMLRHGSVTPQTLLSAEGSQDGWLPLEDVFPADLYPVATSSPPEVGATVPAGVPSASPANGGIPVGVPIQPPPPQGSLATAAATAVPPQHRSAPANPNAAPPAGPSLPSTPPYDRPPLLRAVMKWMVISWSLVCLLGLGGCFFTSLLAGADASRQHETAGAVATLIGFTMSIVGWAVIWVLVAIPCLAIWMVSKREPTSSPMPRRSRRRP